MKIEILDTGCPTCSGLEDNVREALEKTGKKAEIIDEIKSSGQIISIEQIRGLLNEIQS